MAMQSTSLNLRRSHGLVLKMNCYCTKAMWAFSGRSYLINNDRNPPSYPSESRHVLAATYISTNMDDETAEIELVRPCRRWLHHFLDMATLVGTEPDQNTADISENDLCAIIAFPRLLSYHLPAAILTSFDSRLVKLEKSILPLYTSTQILTKRGNSMSRTPCLVPISDEQPDIESALSKPPA